MFDLRLASASAYQFSLSWLESASSASASRYKSSAWKLNLSPMPNRLTYHKLAAETGLTARSSTTIISFKPWFGSFWEIIVSLSRSVQIWFQNTRNRKKRLANYLNNCNQTTTTSVADDYSIEYSQTPATTTQTQINDYITYNQATTTPRTENYHETTTAAIHEDVPNKNIQSMTYASSLPQPFVNEPTMTASEKTTKAKTTTTSTKIRITTTDENQDKVDRQQQKSRQSTIIKTTAAATLISKEDDMQYVIEDEEDKTSEAN